MASSAEPAQTEMGDGMPLLRQHTATARSRLARLLRVLPAAALVGTVLLPVGPAQAQATRTWVSGVGDDANPCSRTAPCRTFAGAISKTAAKGEINTLDPGGFGGVTITKSLTINACTSGMGGVLVSGTNAIVINTASAADRVTLRCLDINGIGTSLNAIRILHAGSVKITDSEIFGFTRNAVDVENSNSGLEVLVARTLIRDNTGVGVMVAPSLSAANAKVTLRNNDIHDNACGVVAATFGVDPAFNYAVNCGTRPSSPGGISSAAQVNVLNNLIADHGATGVFSRGAAAVQRIKNNEVVGNDAGLAVVDGGQILSFGDNLVTGNNNNGAPTGTIGPSAP
jgi:hypothetical protein